MTILESMIKHNLRPKASFSKALSRSKEKKKKKKNVEAFQEPRTRRLKEKSSKQGQEQGYFKEITWLS